MNDVPLIQNADVNSINTSIIAIKKQLNQISELLGLIDIPDAPDLSPFVRKDEVADVIEADNMNPVTSNAVAVSKAMPVNTVTSGNMYSVSSNAVSNSLSYSTTEQLTGGKWKDGKPIYRRVYDFTGQEVINNYVLENDASFIDTLITYSGCLIWKSTGNLLPFPWSVPQTYASLYKNTAQVKLLMQINLDAVATNLRFFIEYTKAS